MICVGEVMLSLIKISFHIIVVNKAQIYILIKLLRRDENKFILELIEI